MPDLSPCIRVASRALGPILTNRVIRFLFQFPVSILIRDRLTRDQHLIPRKAATARRLRAKEPSNPHLQEIRNELSQLSTRRHQKPRNEVSRHHRLRPRGEALFLDCLLTRDKQSGKRNRRRVNRQLPIESSAKPYFAATRLACKRLHHPFTRSPLPLRDGE